VGRRIVRFLNFLTRLRRPRCEPHELLLLLPSCLQRTECPQKLTSDPQNCQRCGRCRMKELLELAERYGCQCRVVGGGRLALEIAKRDGVKAVVAVACEKELQAGMGALLPKPALGVINVRPHGPCRDTDANVSEVEEAIRFFLPPRSPECQEAQPHHRGERQHAGAASANDQG